MNIFQRFKQDVQNIVVSIFTDIDFSNINIETPKEKTHGDLSVNIAMIIAAKTKANPRDIALLIKDHLIDLEYIDIISIAGPGFINVTLKRQIYYQALTSILKQEDNYLKINFAKKDKINIEYVSANPTGPMHIGHARGAVYGDVLASLLIYCGHEVTKEYYVNDFGGQITTLAESLYIRYKEISTKEKIEIPQGLYPGEYLIEPAKKLFNQYQDKLLYKSQEEYIDIVKKFAVDEMLILIKNDLEDLGIKHDIFFHESSLHESGAIDTLIAKLLQEGFIYKGFLPQPKGKHKEDFTCVEQLIFKTTEFGDDQDRPLKKPDDSWSYYASDLAYANNKIKRGFDKSIMILGADHIGYLARMKAIFAALGSPNNLEIKICQLVNYVDNGVAIKMSKRGGTFSSVRDAITAVGKDILRFIMLTKKNDVIIDFDLTKVKELSKDNPIFYVQYAYVRIKSLFTKYEKEMLQNFDFQDADMINYNLLSLDEELYLIKKIMLWPKILESSAIYYEPHRITYFLYECASQFHSLWSYTSGVNYRFIIADNKELTLSRLSLAKALMNILKVGLDIIGIKPMDKM